MARCVGWGLALILGLLASVEPSWGQKLAVLCKTDRKVRLFDGDDGKILGEANAGKAPRGMALANEALRLYIIGGAAETGSESVLTAIGAINGGLEAELPLGGCEDVADIEKGAENRLFVACAGSDDVLEIGAMDGSIVGRIRVGPGAMSLGFHPEPGLLAIANGKTGELALFDMEARSIVKVIKGAAKAPRPMTLGYGGTLLALLDSQTGTLKFLEPESEMLSHSFEVGKDPRNVQLVAETETVLVTVAGDTGLVGADLEEEKVLRQLDVGPEAWGIAVDQAGQRAWVSSEGGNTVSVVQLDRWEVLKTFPIPGGPGDLILVRE